MTDQATPKGYRNQIRDELGRFAAPTFNFDQLPVEVQEMIIIKAAVARRLTSETFGDVFEALAPVCKLWLDLLKTTVVYEKVKQETILRDPMCRYLQTTQSIRVTGILEMEIWNVVILGEKLYAVEVMVMGNFTRLSNVSRIFVYDLDASAACHVELKKRIVACTNRQPLVVLGLNEHYSICQLVPCSRTNTLFVLEHDFHSYGNWAVHKVKPDGTVLLRWVSHFYAYSMTYMSLSLSGAYIVMTNRRYGNRCVTVCVYSTSTGAFMNQVDTTSNPASVHGGYVLTNGTFLTPALSDDCLEDLAKLSSSKRYDDRSIALDDRVLLLLGDNNLVDTRTGRRRQLQVDRVIQRRLTAPDSWYDKARGLLFSAHVGGLNVSRITY